MKDKTKTLIIDGDTNEVLEVRQGKHYPINGNTFKKLKKEFGKDTVFCASNGCYGKSYTVFIVENKES